MPYIYTAPFLCTSRVIFKIFATNLTKSDLVYRPVSYKCVLSSIRGDICFCSLKTLDEFCCFIISWHIQGLKGFTFVNRKLVGWWLVCVYRKVYGANYFMSFLTRSNNNICASLTSGIPVLIRHFLWIGSIAQEMCAFEHRRDMYSHPLIAPIITCITGK